jgi:hypothetical protein
MSKPGIETRFRERRSAKTTAVDRRSNAGSTPEPKDQTVRENLMFLRNGRRAGHDGRQKTPVVSTPKKNWPSLLLSFFSTASQQASSLSDCLASDPAPFITNGSLESATVVCTA